MLARRTKKFIWLYHMFRVHTFNIPYTVYSVYIMHESLMIYTSELLLCVRYRHNILYQ